MDKTPLYLPQQNFKLNFARQLVLLACLAQFLSGCLPQLGLIQTAITNPQTLVGKYFEVEPSRPLVGSQNFENYAEFRHRVKREPASKEDTREAVKGGLIVFLDKGTNCEENSANLIFQIVGFKKSQLDKRDIFLEIKICNKKYVGTTWWVYAGDLAWLAKPIDSPYPTAPPNHSKSGHHHKQR